VGVWASGKCFQVKFLEAVVIEAGEKFKEASNPVSGMRTKAAKANSG
jgi:hypothetical protein